MKELNKKNQQNQSLVPFLRPASKQSNSSLTKTREFVEEQKCFTNWNDMNHEGWGFPATAEPHCWCGFFTTLGCPYDIDHKRLGYGYRVFVKQFPRSCYRPICTTCYLKWISRESNKATTRIEEYERQNPGKKPIHVFFSPPKWMQGYSVEKLREEVKLVLKKTKVDGGSIIFHPFRKYPKTRNWYYSPHFHFVGFGSYRNIATAFGWKRWYVGNKGFRKSVFQTYCYLLSHCGVKKRNHTVTWVRGLSYSKLHVPKIESLTNCPACGRKFIEIYYDGIHPVVPPDRQFEGLVDSDGRWYPVENEPEQMPTDFEYAPTRDLNEILRGIALAV